MCDAITTNHYSRYFHEALTQDARGTTSESFIDNVEHTIKVSCLSFRGLWAERTLDSLRKIRRLRIEPLTHRIAFTHIMAPDMHPILGIISPYEKD